MMYVCFQIIIFVWDDGAYSVETVTGIYKHAIAVEVDANLGRFNADFKSRLFQASGVVVFEFPTSSGLPLVLKDRESHSANVIGIERFLFGGYYLSPYTLIRWAAMP